MLWCAIHHLQGGLFARLLAYIENNLVENVWFWTEIRVPSLKMVYGTPKHVGAMW